MGGQSTTSVKLAVHNELPSIHGTLKLVAEGEGRQPLEDYIQQFLKAYDKTNSLNEDSRVMALAVKLKEMSSLWSDLCLKVVYTMNDFLDKADGFIKLEEDVTQAKGSIGGKKKSPDSQTPATKAQENGKKGGSNRGKRSKMVSQ
uniref:Uncharacterized protein n=1 Tax=Cannabis sativa TaxID=3483 RepID=A0A803P334_CANSA